MQLYACVYFRYLGSGCSMADLHYAHRVGYSTIHNIVKEVCDEIWNKLLDRCIPLPTREGWLKICEDFEKYTNFPNCIGAIDGKHIRLVKPHQSGSLYYNYKNFFSLVLLAICDANYCFTYIDIGSFGKDNDSNIFKNSSFYKLLIDDKLNIPPTKQIGPNPNDLFPFVFVADEAFSLTESVLRPYSGNQISEIKRIFNYRLTRARRYIECSFGILANKWRIFHRPLNVSVELAESITKCCCVLHNFVRRRDGYRNEDYEVQCNNVITDIQTMGPAQGGRTANKIRDSFAQFFMTDEGALPWQAQKI